MRFKEKGKSGLGLNQGPLAGLPAASGLGCQSITENRTQDPWPGLPVVSNVDPQQFLAFLEIPLMVFSRCCSSVMVVVIMCQHLLNTSRNGSFYLV